jgi:hypothetical protein
MSEMTNFNRRSLITGLISFAVTAPAIVRAASLMPVKVIRPDLTIDEFAKRILEPMLNKLEKQIAVAIMYGNSYSINNQGLIKIIAAKDLYID